MNVIADTVIQTTEAVLPAILLAAGMSNPALASAAAMAPAIVQAMQMATAFQQAGFMTPEQLSALFATIGKNVQSTHDQWAAMNAQEKS